MKARWMLEIDRYGDGWDGFQHDIEVGNPKDMVAQLRKTAETLVKAYEHKNSKGS